MSARERSDAAVVAAPDERGGYRLRPTPAGRSGPALCSRPCRGTYGRRARTDTTGACSRTDAQSTFRPAPCVPCRGFRERCATVRRRHPAHRRARVLEQRSREGRPFDPYPDGDYHVLLAQDLRFDTFGHLWEHTPCVFGTELLDTIDQNVHHNLGPPLRRTGRPPAEGLRRGLGIAKRRVP
ncbi:DUF2716 domain-containing protein [Embleya sp. MST-111070]|uniref:DUF2716 domain-containing protein n=1 Tax=Embleya sp. MST-111070 TaxID=3398231 RepID=UPI003F73A546